MSRRRAAERLVWAVDTMGVGPTDRLLEIGCGHGVAVSLVCERLDGGSITAIDRSPTMIEMARKRNADCVAAGVASFQAAELRDADLGGARFDKIFAIHVGVFLRGRPARELAVIKRHLTPGDTLYLVDQPLVPDQAGPTVQRLSAVLEANGFRVGDVLVRDLAGGRVTCVVAQPEPPG
jgi:trans-aconitate methyltransferase